MRAVPVGAAAFLAAVVIGTAGCGGPDSQQLAAALKRAASAAPSWVHRDPLGKRLWALEQKFYAERRHQPAWIDGDHPTPQLDALLAALHDAELHGLRSASYGYGTLAAERAKADEPWLRDSFEPNVIPDLDLRLTYAFLAHASDLLGWRSSPRRIDRNWLPAPKKADLLQHLRDALKGNRVRGTLDALAPEHPQYKGLQAALARARNQQGDGLDIDRIRMNLERWRWAPRDLGDRHVLINIPSYQMQVIEGGKTRLAMRVIVGEPETPTPLFSDKMTYVVFSPSWNVPESIQREEMLPRLVDDPEFLERNNIEVVSTSGEPVDPWEVDWTDSEMTDALRFRQLPGPDNALGLVKFIFPNNFNVYLHDTPTDSLFNKERRTFSHGCIRIEQPVALAEYVLQDKAHWTPARIRAAMHSKEEQSVVLREPIPVHIGYWTAWVQEDGSVAYLDDPYGLDRRQASVQSPRRAE
jgi:murein L,D-transpeptidase YcbB/YkuD